MEKVKDFTNTWCKATKENYSALVAEGLEEEDSWTWNEIQKDPIFDSSDILYCVDNKFFSWSQVNVYGKVKIELVKGEFYYSDSINIEQCLFTKYGFNKQDNCVILTKVGSWLIGYYKRDNQAPIPCMWFEHDGKVAGNTMRVPNLEPIEKPWYEKKENFPCFLVADTDKGKMFAWVHYYKDGYAYDAKDSKYKVMGTTNWRPATHEEMLAELNILTEKVKG